METTTAAAAATLSASQCKKQQQGKVFRAKTVPNTNTVCMIMRVECENRKKMKRTLRRGWAKDWMVMKYWMVIALIIITIIVIMYGFVLNLNCFLVANARSLSLFQPNARFMRFKVNPSSSLGVSRALVLSIADPIQVNTLSLSHLLWLSFWRHWFKISCNLTQCLFYIKSP